jgi:SAM-dependent methyltransferase
LEEFFVRLLQDPVSGESLELEVFETAISTDGHKSITEGILHSKSGAVFPIVKGVPVMIPSACPQGFLNKHRAAIEALGRSTRLQIGSGAADDFSFSIQWDQYREDGVEGLWGWTIDERVEQLLLEMQVDRGWFRGKTILDAGCGPGDLSRAIAALGATVVGFDYSSSVYHAEQLRQSPDLLFMRADVAAPGLKDESFDAVFSLGVIMFTPEPYRGFAELCRVVKPGGRFYINLDRHRDTFVSRYIKHPPLDLARRFISRLPVRPQAIAVKAWATVMAGIDRIIHGETKGSRGEYLLSAYNFMTPRWRHYHTADQLAGWFYKNGFAPPVMSHWDNPYAFGLVATKEKQSSTPGVHFGQAPKLWETSGDSSGTSRG